MRKVKRWLKVILGSFIIGASINLFFKSLNLVPCGMFGFSVLYSNSGVMDLWLTFILVNMLFILLSLLILPTKYSLKTLYPVIFITLSIMITQNIDTVIKIKDADYLLLSLYGGVLVGLGSRLIYKEKMYTNASDLLKIMFKEVIGLKANYIPYIIDAIWVIFSIKVFGYELMLYSIISIVIMESLSHRANLGVSESKVFYIITKEEKLVKEYIMDEIGCEITVFDTKGGFTKNKNKVLMTVIPTKYYYKLREHIKKIDKTAFMTITDSYEVINANKNIKGSI